MKKGISLVALVITIIVLIILTGAVILSFQDGGIIDRADQAVEDNNDAVLEEKITMMNLEYTQKLKPKFTEETRETLKAIVKQSGIDLDKLLVYYERTDGEQLVFYKLDKVTKSEVKWFIDNPVKVEIDGEEKEKKIYQLIGDIDLDGDFDEEDYNRIERYTVYKEYDVEGLPRDNMEYIRVVASISGSSRLTSDSYADFKNIIEGDQPYSHYMEIRIEDKIGYLKTYFGIE